MFSKKALILTGALMTFVGAGATAVVMRDTKSEAPKVAMYKTATQAAPEVTATDGETIQLVDLVQISNPFENNDDTSFSFATVDDGKFSNISAMTSYDIAHPASSLVELPADFGDVGAGLTSLDSGEQITIVQKFNFSVGSTIAWETPKEESTVYVWEEHPEEISMKPGSQAIVTYTSTDGGIHWTGAVNVFNNGNG